MYSPQRPVHAGLRRVEARLATFNTPGREWQGHYIRATPRQLAEAGFFYIGEADRVKCWHCNGGLCNWLVDDDPLTEHSKWYPSCEFLLQLVGPEFVDDVIASVHANGQPPFRATIDTTVYHVQAGGNLTSHSISTGNAQRRVDEYLTESQFVSTLRQMGFADVVLRRAVERQVGRRNEVFHGLGDLLDAVVRLPPVISSFSQPESVPNAQQTRHRRTNSTGEARRRSSSSGSEEEEELSPSIEREVEQLRQARMCRECRRESANVVFLPCGHLHACSGCAERYEECPSCGSRVSERIRSFIV